jgi:hypothetical protein
MRGGRLDSPSATLGQPAWRISRRLVWHPARCPLLDNC